MSQKRKSKASFTWAILPGLEPPLSKCERNQSRTAVVEIELHRAGVKTSLHKEIFLILAEFSYPRYMKPYLPVCNYDDAPSLNLAIPGLSWTAEFLAMPDH